MLIIFGSFVDEVQIYVIIRFLSYVQVKFILRIVVEEGYGFVVDCGEMLERQ